jgi:hypothetical protein
MRWLVGSLYGNVYVVRQGVLQRSVPMEGELCLVEEEVGKLLVSDSTEVTAPKEYCVKKSLHGDL